MTMKRNLIVNDMAYLAISRCFSWLMLGAAVVTSLAHSGLVNAGDRDTSIMGHHIRLEGTTVENFFINSYNFSVQQCAAQNLTVSPIPTGEKNYTSSTDIYYVQGAVTTHTRTKAYIVKADPPCQLGTSKTESAQIDATGGTCSVNLVTRVATGKCQISVAQLSKRFTPFHQGGVPVPTGEAKIIAGHKCAIYLSKLLTLNIRSCLTSKESFDGLAPGLRSAPGALLSEEIIDENTPDKPLSFREAVKIESNVPIPISILLPQFADNITIRK